MWNFFNNVHIILYSKYIGFYLNAIFGLFQFFMINTLTGHCCYLILMNCRLWGFCSLFLQVGWLMWFLKIQYKGKQYSLPMVPHYIRCFFYLPQSIVQMFGFLHTSKRFNFIVWICLARWLFCFQFEISSVVNAHHFLALKVFALVLPIFHSICAAGSLLCYKLDPCRCLWEFQEWGKFFCTITSLFMDLIIQLKLQNI